MKMNYDNSESIYNELVNVFEIKFKAQFNNSSIEFEKFLRVRDMVSKKEDYLLSFNNKKSIRFENKLEFIDKFILILKSDLQDLENQYNALQKREREERSIDENAVFIEHETIGYNGNKLEKLLEKMEKIKGENL
jgi:hypothetical protein